MPSNRVSALLATPALTRPLLLPRAFRSSWVPTRIPTYTSQYSPRGPYRQYAATKAPAVAAFAVPEFRTEGLKEISTGKLLSSQTLIAQTLAPLEDDLATLFTKNPATFHYGNQSFYYLKKNTRIPEICILGRSNVGKSSLINALADRTSSNLANVSKHAGRTRSINMYGFGPPPTDIPSGAEYKGKEDLPTHSLYLVDMPGYGHGSIAEWGKHIDLYLRKRNFLKGAILLIDAKVGPKDTDWHALQILSSAQVRTAVVLTKADKVRGGVEELRSTCEKVCEGLRAIEMDNEDRRWTWEKNIFVTAAGSKDHTIIKSTVATVRLAISRLAGLTSDNQPKEESNKKWSGSTVSYEELFGSPSADSSGTPSVLDGSRTKSDASWAASTSSAENSFPQTASESETEIRVPSGHGLGSDSRAGATSGTTRVTTNGRIGRGRRLPYRRGYSTSATGMPLIQRVPSRDWKAKPAANEQAAEQEANRVLHDFMATLRPRDEKYEKALRLTLEEDMAEAERMASVDPVEATRARQAAKRQFFQTRHPKLTERARKVREARIAETERQVKQQGRLAQLDEVYELADEWAQQKSEGGEAEAMAAQRPPEGSPGMPGSRFEPLRSPTKRGESGANSKEEERDNAAADDSDSYAAARETLKQKREVIRKEFLEYRARLAELDANEKGPTEVEEDDSEDSFEAYFRKVVQEADERRQHRLKVKKVPQK